jgi:hypothetical protein
MVRSLWSLHRDLPRVVLAPSLRPTSPPRSLPILHQGTFYGVEFGEYGWRVLIGMRIVCDGLDTEEDAIRWIKGR